MTSKRTISVIDPNGVAHHRTTARTYTHAVLVKELTTVKVAEHRAQAARYTARADEYEAEWARPASESSNRCHQSPECVARHRKDAAQAEVFAQQLEATGHTYTYGVWGWCGRHDLAVKLQDQAHRQCSGRVGGFHTVIVEVQV